MATEVAGNLAQDPAFASWPPDEGTVRCPWSYFDRLRSSSPVYRYPQPGPDGVHTFIVTGFEAACAVLMSPRVFINNLRHDDESPEPKPLPGVPTFYKEPSIFFTDGQDHSIKRNWALKFVDRSKLGDYAAIITERVDALIDSFAARGHCDFKAEFSEAMPMQVIRQLMGLPDIADPMIRRMSEAIPPIDNNPDATPAMIAEFEESTLDLVTLCAELVQSRFENPTGDFVSEIVTAQFARDGALDPNTLAKHIMVMIFGADHAMGGHLADIMARIGSDPALQERIRADRSLIWPLAVESLRHANPVPWLFRRCVTDTEIAGVAIPAGSTVLVSTAAANYDPAEFPDPHRLDIDRPNVERNHLALGRGIHRCVGSPMARLQAEITVNRMLDRLDDIRLDTELSDLAPLFSLGFRIATSVHLTFKPR